MYSESTTIVIFSESDLASRAQRTALTSPLLLDCVSPSGM